MVEIQVGSLQHQLQESCHGGRQLFSINLSNSQGKFGIETGVGRGKLSPPTGNSTSGKGAGGIRIFIVHLRELANNTAAAVRQGLPRAIKEGLKGECRCYFSFGRGPR